MNLLDLLISWIYPYFLFLKTSQLVTTAVQDLMQAAKSLQAPWLLWSFFLPASLHSIKPMRCAAHASHSLPDMAHQKCEKIPTREKPRGCSRAVSVSEPIAGSPHMCGSISNIGFISFPQGFKVFSALLGLETAEGSKRQQRRFCKLGCVPNSDICAFDAVVANRPALGKRTTWPHPAVHC